MINGLALHHGDVPLHMAMATVKASHGMSTVKASHGTATVKGIMV